jgi:hypothetical protein
MKLELETSKEVTKKKAVADARALEELRAQLAAEKQKRKEAMRVLRLEMGRSCVREQKTLTRPVSMPFFSLVVLRLIREMMIYF